MMQSKYIDPRHKVLYHVEHIQALREGRKMPPINVEIDLSNRCSLGCEWCHFGYTHTRGPLAGKRERPSIAVGGGDLMKTELAIKLINELNEYGVQSITWTGGGEPTLHPDFDDIIFSTLMAQGIYTNGCHISEERAHIMKGVMSWIYVSLDECTPGDYKNSKGIDKFNAALNGIRNLVSADGNATMGIGFMIHENNYSKVKEMRSLALDELGVDYVQFRPTVRYDQESPNEFMDDSSWIHNAMILLSELDDDERVYTDLDRWRIYRDWQSHGYDICHFSGLQTVITPNGKVWACVNKREHGDALLGDLTKESFRDIWERHEPCTIDSSCRLMCRGHMANLTLDKIMKEPKHAEFI